MSKKPSLLARRLAAMEERKKTASFVLLLVAWSLTIALWLVMGAGVHYGLFLFWDFVDEASLRNKEFGYSTYWFAVPLWWIVTTVAMFAASAALEPKPKTEES